ncbi:MAG: XkdF-like putative serine protease domain-containing protein [Oscillospiraceae bacterium]|nr:XkdF-like putative serine protease domain-containing protein [Oscillospiraceae bacterium]
MKVEKAIEISDAKIQFVSLVDKAANKRQFLITKADDGQAQFSTVGKILKTDTDTHYVTGIVYEPLTEDAHGNYMTEAEIRKAAYWFAKNGDKVDLQHSFEQADGLSVVETYVAPSDMEIEGTPVVKGTWLMTVEVQNDEVWDKVQKGEVTGFSMGGMGKYSETETDLSETVEKRGILKRFAGLLGVDTVEKGEVKDRYNRNHKSRNFWAALNALEDTLLKYDYNGENFETDDNVIREALTDFSQIITAVLSEPNVMMALTENAPVKKAGRKISGKNRDTLQAIYDNLGSLLDEFSDNDEKEEQEVTKTEIQALVDESVRKALDAAQGEQTPAENAPTAETPVTAEAVQKMVDSAVQKALTPAEEPMTAEAVQEMVEKAVAKAVEPVLKARGLSSNLNDEQPIEKKNETRHYLAGIL